MSASSSSSSSSSSTDTDNESVRMESGFDNPIVSVEFEDMAAAKNTFRKTDAILKQVTTFVDCFARQYCHELKDITKFRRKLSGQDASMAAEVIIASFGEDEICEPSRRGGLGFITCCRVTCFCSGKCCARW